MLSEAADGVLVHTSAWCRTNAVVVVGDTGVLVVDPGIHESEIGCLADDLQRAGHTVVAGFATHPHWDHLLWHPALGAVDQWATALAADTARRRLANGIDAKRFGIPDDVRLDGLGDDLAGLPAGADRIPWDGPTVRILEHRAHAPGHAALLVDGAGVLVAGDMLSDVFVPMLDLAGAPDPLDDYLAALFLLEAQAGEATVVIPGHGSVGDATALRDRLARDRAYVEALVDGYEPHDARVESPRAGWEFVRSVHDRQLDQLSIPRSAAGDGA
ncbi:MBL fold metallo-hydrolase [Leifsonia shinshuensis]|uniref:MBL fold metallo-hydrolase n=1 Tax=Leifsonia shinshuensis TaxID=150026 RepID=UPI001F50ACAC|nr:MBL fold metallo-hydrolase [Leifsonia shinshuensis]MCI0158939.1 MBL fold metallo-hydrolase [Leifsonia shinshuensis]